MNIFKKYPLPFLFLAIFTVVYLYFFYFRTQIATGDDLYTFRDHFNAHTFAEQLKIPMLWGKYRPINAISFNTIILFFNKNLFLYYLYNTLILSINIFIFALLLNYFLNSYLYSFLFSLTMGLSRFFYYHICQLLIGGGLEGLALVFFLLIILYTLKAFTNNAITERKRYQYLLLSILFGNLAMYTHERYITVFVFTLLIVLFFPKFRQLSALHKTVLSTLSVTSVAANYYIKEYIYSIPFFTGTSATQIEFSFSSAFGFFKESIFSIFEINTGPDYLVGISFAALPTHDKLISAFIAVSLLAIIAIYFYKAPLAIFRYLISTVVNPAALKKINYPKHLSVVIFLSFLVILCIVPSVVTVRLEQRWLVASYATFVLMIVIMLSDLHFKHNILKHSFFLLLTLSILWINNSYLYKGLNNFYMHDAQVISQRFKNAIDNGVIQKKTEKLYLWDVHKDVNAQNAIIWSICEGYLFKFYDAGDKQIYLVDSIYKKTDTTYTYALPDFDTNKCQVILLGAELSDITSEYVKDSLRTFTKEHK